MAAENRPDVELRIPADSAYLSVLRTVTAGLAARLDFTLDDIEDLRIAVDEATAMVLPQTLPGSDLSCAFLLGEDRLDVAVTADCDSPRVPSQDGFAWTVLSALTSTLDAQVDGDSLTVKLSRVSGESA
ncbi:MAG: anti-sigma regulatory factor [Actinomycetota bacterium]|nr:anti-sigma regulatory factor [Actinomycetota bacterium]